MACASAHAAREAWGKGRRHAPRLGAALVVRAVREAHAPKQVLGQAPPDERHLVLVHERRAAVVHSGAATTARAAAAAATRGQGAVVIGQPGV